MPEQLQLKKVLVKTLDFWDAPILGNVWKDSAAVLEKVQNAVVVAMGDKMVDKKTC